MAGILLLLALGGHADARAHIPRADKPSIIMVPGAFHKAKVYEKVTYRLRQKNYSRLFAIDLPSVGSSAGRVEDVGAVRSTLLNELDAGRDVLLVGNSYGGTVIGEAVKGLKDYPTSCTQPRARANMLSRATSFLPRGGGNNKECGKILGLVFFAGYLPYIKDVEHPENKPDVRTVSPSFFHFTLDGKVTSDGDASIPPSVSFYNDLSPQDAAYWTSQLTFSSFDSLNATATYIPYTGDFKCRYVVGTLDNSVSESFAQSFLLQPGVQFQVEHIDAGHVPMIGKPDEVVRLIQNAAYDQGN
jgi:pimeloyl-ACP methyl ester carboxylesterase